MNEKCKNPRINRFVHWRKEEKNTFPEARGFCMRREGACEGRLFSVINTYHQKDGVLLVPLPYAV